MLKTIVWISILLTLVVGLGFGAINNSLAKNESESAQQIQPISNDLIQPDGQETSISQNEDFNSPIDETSLSEIPEATFTQLASSTNSGFTLTNELTELEIAALNFMREEEKLAHDIYLYLYEIWGQPTFQNIAASEQNHTQAVLSLLDRYGLEDPASEDAGKFTNQELQALYDTLIAQGSQSLIEALKVGAAIEEIDILDLETRIEQTASPDILRVFENLKKGSINHLRAFTNTLTSQTGAAYQPQYLSESAYQVMFSTSQRNGRSGYRVGRP